MMKRLSEFRFRRAECADVHESLAVPSAENDVLVVAEGDSPNGVAGLGELADEGAGLEICAEEDRSQLGTP